MSLREKYGEWGVILGATEGVGKAFCEKIAAGGMSVVMVGRREEKLRELAAQIEETYGVKKNNFLYVVSEIDHTDRVGSGSAYATGAYHYYYYYYCKDDKNVQQYYYC